MVRHRLGGWPFLQKVASRPSKKAWNALDVVAVVEAFSVQMTLKTFAFVVAICDMEVVLSNWKQILV
ncbi:unnamed protein product [Strongylus vulgaris]|uniref:Uncharacterized protein n=1 Tax=Strongylus vulgaris TaxID=40348 RepID=A0A3P7IF02_STRVU|nr:unnamed protein product [Strongylus vulgaris]